MRFKYCTVALVTMSISLASAQVASHAPTKTTTDPALPPAQTVSVKVTGKTVAKVNGAVLTDRDLIREMFAIFPYGQQHNGFPKGLEPEIRKGALDMIIFEELVYQEAKRRNMTISPEKMARAEADFRKQFPTKAVFDQYLKVEKNGSKQALREEIRRSLLIEAILKTEIANKAVVTSAEAKTFYDKNPQKFTHGETIHIQSISILPPANAAKGDVKKKAEEIYNQAKLAKSYQQFGLLAERFSDDDFHVNMGDHKPLTREQLPPPIVNAVANMKSGDVSEPLQLGDAYTIFRLVDHKAPGLVPFDAVKKELTSDLQKEKTQKIRSALAQKLRKTAKIETL